MKPEPTHYDNLMVSRNASLEVIRAAYRALTQKYHPDRHPDDAEATRLMQVINESYAVIGDPEKRQEYDRGLAEQERTLALALGNRRAVPVLQEAQEYTSLEIRDVPVLGEEAPAEAPSHHPRNLGRLASLTFGAAFFMAAGAGAYRYAQPQFSHGPPASPAATAASEPSASSTERRQWESGAIARSSAVSSSGSGAGAARSESSAASSDSGTASSESRFASTASGSVESHVATSTLTRDLVDRSRKILAQHPAVKAAAKRRAHPPKRVVPPAHQMAAETAPVAPVPPPVDDLAEVRTRDPAAADRISSYCSVVAKTAIESEKGGTACRRNETVAWRHFAVTSNFSKIYEEVGTRCAASIYPDSYEAKEACVRYELGNQRRSD